MDEIQEREIRQRTKEIQEINQQTAEMYDRLRSSVERIFGIFRGSNYCQVCGLWKSKHDQGHKFTPGVDLYVSYQRILFMDSEGEWWGISAIPGNGLLFFRYKEGPTGWQPAYSRVEDVSMNVLQKTIESFSIPRFLDYYTDELKQKNKNYEKINKITEKIYEAILSIITPQ